jgi:hypothetical protein
LVGVIVVGLARKKNEKKKVSVFVDAENTVCVIIDLFTLVFKLWKIANEGKWKIFHTLYKPQSDHFSQIIFLIYNASTPFVARQKKKDLPFYYIFASC